eukprot:4354556-Heterocapsa_arctica.AAC.1
MAGVVRLPAVVRLPMGILRGVSRRADTGGSEPFHPHSLEWAAKMLVAIGAGVGLPRILQWRGSVDSG